MADFSVIALGRVLVLLLSLTAIAGADPLTKEDLLKMGENGVSASLILKLVERHCVDFEINAENVIELSRVIPDTVIEAVLECTERETEEEISSKREPIRGDAKLPDFVPPQAVRRVNADYPAELRRRHLKGIVILEFVVDSRGSTKDIRTIMADHEEFVPLAINAIKQWTYTPGTLKGEPVETIMNATVTFSLNE